MIEVVIKDMAVQNTIKNILVVLHDIQDNIGIKEEIINGMDMDIAIIEIIEIEDNIMVVDIQINMNIIIIEIMDIKSLIILEEIDIQEIIVGKEMKIDTIEMEIINLDKILTIINNNIGNLEHLKEIMNKTIIIIMEDINFINTIDIILVLIIINNQIHMNSIIKINNKIANLNQIVAVVDQIHHKPVILILLIVPKMQVIINLKKGKNIEVKFLITKF